MNLRKTIIKFIKIGLIGFCIINLLLIGRAVYYDNETRDLDETARKEFVGDYIQTTQGWVRYSYHQSDSQTAPTVLFIGGLTTDGIDFFNPIAQQFAEEGFSTLQFDLFGRGGSERLANADYGRQTYVQQINDLLNALEITQPIHVVGQSLGGGIGATWASQHPKQAKSLSIHASAGHISGQDGMINLLETPIIGRYVFWLIKDKLTTGRVPSYFDDLEDDTEMINRISGNIKKAAKFNGYQNAVYKTIINFEAHDMETVFKSLGKSDVPIQFIWGKSDEIIPLENAQILQNWIGRESQLITYDNVGHMPLAENPTETVSDVLTFIETTNQNNEPQ